MKKLMTSIFLILILLGCSNSNINTNQENLNKYYAEIQAKIDSERNKDPRGKYKRALTEKEASNNPLSFKNMFEVENENGYKNIYNAYNEQLIYSYQLNSRGEINGVYKKFYYTGELMEIGYTEKENIRSGVIREYYKNGDIFSEISLYKNKKNGYSKFYYENNILREKYIYINDKENGEGIGYYPDGSVLHIDKYNHGKLISRTVFEQSQKFLLENENKIN